MKRRQLVKLFAGILPAATLCFPAYAENAPYPNKPIRMIVSTSAGGMTDVVARLYADSVSKALKQPVVVENMPGASTLLSSRYVAKQAPDGYTLLVAANTIVAMPHVEKDAGYTMKNFTGIAELSRAPSLLVVGGKSNSKSIAELVAAAKKSPGAVHYGFTGHGTTSHLTAEMFARSAGVRFGGIPYKGISLAVPDVVSGRVEFLMGPATSTEGLIKSGQMRALAITSNTRSPAFPDVPTFKELGYPDVTFSLFFGVLAPAGTPGTVTSTLANAMEAAKKDPIFIERLKALGQDISDVRTPDQFNASLRQEEDKSVKLIKATNDLFKQL